jgi:hypothetical protein
MSGAFSRLLRELRYRYPASPPLCRTPSQNLQNLHHFHRHIPTYERRRFNVGSCVDSSMPPPNRRQTETGRVPSLNRGESRHRVRPGHRPRVDGWVTFSLLDLDVSSFEAVTSTFSDHQIKEGDEAMNPCPSAARRHAQIFEAAQPSVLTSPPAPSFCEEPMTDESAVFLCQGPLSQECFSGVPPTWFQHWR